jgi:hypothetical protein
MPEANNQFTGSKMNKDLSPRLIPSTQYIDARNATVLNSEGGESGLLQNVEGNTLLTNLNLTGENLEIVGLFSDKILDRMFLFVTNWNDPSPEGVSNFASPDSSHYICMYDIKTNFSTTLVSGSFLNFSKTKRILAVNLLEDLLFFTDDRNQPRKININSAISDSTYYTEEANISVLRYFPWNAPRLSKNILSPGKTSQYPLEVRSELLITTQPLVIVKPSGTYIEQVGSAGWTTSGDGIDAYISITIEGTSPNQNISSLFVSDFNVNLTSNITTNPTNKNPTTTTGVIQSATSGAGIGLIVSVTTTGAAGSATVTDVSITSAGTGYLSADTVTFPSINFGGGVGGDLVITLATVPALVTGGNNFSIGDTITIGDGWTGTPSSLANIVLTIGSQNIAQTPTMKDVVSENLPGAIERKVTAVTPSTIFNYGSPVIKGDTVWSSVAIVSADSTPRPILLTQSPSPFVPFSNHFELIQGTGAGIEGLGLEISVSVIDVPSATGKLRVGVGTLNSSISTQVSGAVSGSYFSVPYTTTGTGTSAIFNLITLSATSASIQVVTPGSGFAIGDSIEFTAPAMGTGSTKLVVTLKASDIVTNTININVVSSGNNYSSGNQILILSSIPGFGPIPGLSADLLLDLDAPKLTLLPTSSFVNAKITSTDSNGTPKIVLSDNISITANTGGNQITHDSTSNIAVSDIVTFSANPLYDTTFDGDKDFLSEKFVRFSYRFKFDDNQYSLIAPFTQAAFIPRQDGYFLEDLIPESIDDVEANSDENRAIKSTIIAFFENKVNQVGITIDMPEGVNTPAELYDKLKVIEIDILYKDSDESNIKVIDTITRDSFIGLVTNQYTYNYNASMPIRTLRSVDFSRAADRAPIRAKAQEVAGNRVMYGNYLDRTSRPNKLNYIATSGEKQSYGTYNSFNQVEYPNHNLKQSRSYEIGIVLADKFGRQSDVITSDNSTVFNNYRQNRAGIKSYLGDSLKINWGGVIPSVIDKEGYAGLYSPTNPLGWYSYKVVVKQSAQDYYNVYLPTILNNRPQPDVLRINIRKMVNNTGADEFCDLANDSEPVSDMWLGAYLQGTDTSLSATNVTLSEIDSSGKTLTFTNPDNYTLGNGWASLTISPKNIETNEDLAFITLFSDNINKVSRDLKTSASQDLTFSSSVKLYGRVWNNRHYSEASSSRQYFPSLNGIADDVGRIGLIPDIGVNKGSKGNLAYVSPFYSVPLASVKGGNPYVASINTEKLIGATGGNRYPNVSFEKLRLNVYETTPFESNLDIYYESSSSGLISQLNNYINQDSDINQPSSIIDWSWELNENTVPGTKVNLNWFDVTNSNGVSVVGSDFTGEIIKVVDGNGNILSNTSYFTLEQNTTAGTDQYKFRLKIAIGRYFAYDSQSYIKDRYNFTIRFTKTLASGEVFSKDITTNEANELDNFIPSYTPIPNPIPDAQEFYTNGYRTLYQLDGKNGSANTTDSSIFKRGLLWQVTNVEFLWVGNNNTWTPYSPAMYNGAIDYNKVSWMLLGLAQGAISAETLSYSSEFITLNTNAAGTPSGIVDLYTYNKRVDTQFRVSLKLSDASGLSGSLSTTTTIYFTLREN